ncbi:hypothetical protein I2486_16180 [Cellulophaga sp. E16_2]|uniref:Uncharacterized protein n=1 Tax=Cellulophaga algicola (strain DSM 14237 / IC166 / ACAM 630) TaxID=688270 RepID=E6X5F8_CELAD|nr:MULTISPECIES: hypothetical protein [Cellulophaga]ADV50513.1 hypothetical protein Celal_3243 [Cellulophaga algicola DSM 14237]MBO0592943.1 hypothetical protein [Cellulophaga sp. E16_2]
MKRIQKIKSFIFLMAFIGSATFYGTTQESPKSSAIKNTEYKKTSQKTPLKKANLVTAHVIIK